MVGAAASCGGDSLHPVYFDPRSDCCQEWCNDEVFFVLDMRRTWRHWGFSLLPALVLQYQFLQSPSTPGVSSPLLKLSSPYGFSRLQDFDAATKYASDGLNSSRVCLSGLTPYFEPWGTSLAFTGKVRYAGEDMEFVLVSLFVVRFVFEVAILGACWTFVRSPFCPETGAPWARLKDRSSSKRRFFSQFSMLSGT